MRDAIGVVEACYDLGATDTAWLQRVADAFHDLIDAPPFGTIAYHVDLERDVYRLEAVTQSGGTQDVAGRMRAIGSMFERRERGCATFLQVAQTKVYEAVVRSALREPADHMLLSEFRKVGPTWMYTLGVPGVRDHLLLVNHHIDGKGLTAIAAGLPKRGALAPAQRRMLQMLSAHVKAGLRLRKRVGMLRGVDAPAGGAVIDDRCHVVHAEEEAKSSDAQSLLKHAARTIDTARSSRQRASEDAVSVWKGLVDGRWSMVERFDADGRRYILAYKNDEQIRDPRGLSEMQARVVGLAVRAYSNKLIAYHLGVAEGTVATHLHVAMRKLGVSGRVELVRTLGHRFPFHDARDAHGK